MKTQGAQGILQFQHVTKASPSICKAGPQGVPVFAIDIPQPPCQTSFMGVDNAYGGFVAGEKAGETVKAKWNCKYDAWVSLEEPEIGAPNEQRMGGYRKGFQSVCPGPIKNLKKVGFDATARQGADDHGRHADDAARQAPHHRRVDRRRGHRGCVRRREVGGPAEATSTASRSASPTTSPSAGSRTNPNWLASTAISPEKYGWIGIPCDDQRDQGQEDAEAALRPAASP